MKEEGGGRGKTLEQERNTTVSMDKHIVMELIKERNVDMTLQANKVLMVVLTGGEERRGSNRRGGEERRGWHNQGWKLAGGQELSESLEGNKNSKNG